MALQVVLVEDDPDICEILQFHLEAQDYNVTVIQNGEQALDFLLENPPDLLILDLMLPGINGLDIARALRSEPHTQSLPILMLTARSEEMDVVRGFKLGADDYVTKPFHLNELMARIQALLRRSGKLSERVLRYKTLTINFSHFTASDEEGEIKLTRTEFKLLRALFDAKGQVLSRNQLLTTAWGYDYMGDSRTVDVHVRRLRKKLGQNQNLIETVKGFGYRMVQEAFKSKSS